MPENFGYMKNNFQIHTFIWRPDKMIFMESGKFLVIQGKQAPDCSDMLVFLKDNNI